MPSEFDDAMSEMFAEARAIFGEVPVRFAGEAEDSDVNWNSLGTVEVLEEHGVERSFTVTIEVAKTELSAAPTFGQEVTKDGRTFLVVGMLSEDELTYRVALDSKNAAQ